MQVKLQTSYSIGYGSFVSNVRVSQHYTQNTFTCNFISERGTLCSLGSQVIMQVGQLLDKLFVSRRGVKYVVHLSKYRPSALRCRWRWERWGRNTKYFEALVRNSGGGGRDAERAMAISTKSNHSLIFYRVGNNNFTARSKPFVISIITPYVIDTCVLKTEYQMSNYKSPLIYPLHVFHCIKISFIHKPTVHTRF